MISIRVDNTQDMARLVRLYCDGHISADEYFGAVDAWARLCIAAEVRDMRSQRVKR